MLRSKKQVDTYVKMLRTVDNFRIGLLYLNVSAFKEAAKYLGRSNDLKAKKPLEFCNEKMKIDSNVSVAKFVYAIKIAYNNPLLVK